MAEVYRQAAWHKPQIMFNYVLHNSSFLESKTSLLSIGVGKQSHQPNCQSSELASPKKSIVNPYRDNCDACDHLLLPWDARNGAERLFHDNNLKEDILSFRKAIV
jgi:hypothetical protein